MAWELPKGWATSQQRAGPQQGVAVSHCGQSHAGGQRRDPAKVEE